MLSSLKKKVDYWYMRYLLVTELFMVDKWERRMFHVIALFLLTILGLFNQFIVVGSVRLLRRLYLQYNGCGQDIEELQEELDTSTLNL